jgi:hypothetical protein
MLGDRSSVTSNVLGKKTEMFPKSPNFEPCLEKKNNFKKELKFSPYSELG